MSEISMYEAQKKKLQGLCDEHDLVFRFIKDRYPITLTIKPVQGMDAQISMLENVEEVGYRSPDASMTWIFEDGVLETKVTGGTFTISKTLRTKIETVLVKMIAYWQQYFFRDVMEKNALRPGVMPVIDEDEADDSEVPSMPEGAEPLEEYEDDGEIPSDEELDEDDPDIQEATIVPYSISKQLTALSESTAGAAAIQAMVYGDPRNYELGLFGDYTVRVDESIKGVERMLTILGDAMVGGNLIVDKGFVVATLPATGE